MTNLKGSEKQIKWVKNIILKMDFESVEKTFSGNEAAGKVIDFIKNIESCNFWIEYNGYKAIDLLQTITKSGLAIKGLEFAELAKADQAGNITITKR